MSDVFMSYAREDRERVEPLVRALEAAGLDVWWDPEIDPGTHWDDVIKAALHGAKCVIVAWSKSSIDSYWVKTEAHHARDRDVLIPVYLDAVDPPFGFKLVQGEDLSDWSGDAQYANVQRIIARARQLVTGEAQEMPERAAGGGWFSRRRVAVTLPAALVAAVAAWFYLDGRIGDCGHPHGDWRIVGVAPNDVLNVRSGAGSQNDIIGTIPPKATGISATDCRGTWCHVRYRCVDGWASRRFLAKGDEPAIGETSPSGVYALHCSSVRTEDEAKATAERLRAALGPIGADLSYVAEAVEINGETWHRVSLGRFASRVDANLRKTAVAAAGTECTVITAPRQ